MCGGQCDCEKKMRNEPNVNLGNLKLQCVPKHTKKKYVAC